MAASAIVDDGHKNKRLKRFFIPHGLMHGHFWAIFICSHSLFETPSRTVLSHSPYAHVVDILPRSCELNLP
jgi:hypothetical protein